MINPGEHASTFGGNHFVTGVACTVFDILSQPSFLKDVEEKGQYFKNRLGEIAHKYDVVKEIRGEGLLLAVAVDFPASEAVEYFEKQHILICAAGQNVIRFIPPLIITKDDINRVVETLDTFLSEK